MSDCSEFLRLAFPFTLVFVFVGWFVWWTIETSYHKDLCQLEHLAKDCDAYANVKFYNRDYKGKDNDR